MDALPHLADICRMKTAVITGAGKGIGHAIAVRLYLAGYNVAVCSRTEANLIGLKDELMHMRPDGEVYTFVADLGMPDEARDFGGFVLDKLPHVDVLVNNAGSYTPGQIINEPEEALQAMITNNLYSCYYITRALADSMIPRKKGRIINISSRAGIEPYPNGGSYSISKYAMTGFGQNLRMELQPYNIAVTNIYPGAVYTGSWEGVDIDKNAFVQVEDIAELVNTICHLSPMAVVEDLVIRPMRGDM